jgi:hypothetical protein
LINNGRRSRSESRFAVGLCLCWELHDHRCPRRPGVHEVRGVWRPGYWPRDQRTACGKDGFPVKEHSLDMQRSQRGPEVLPEVHAAAGSGCGQDTVEGLRDMLQEVLDRLAQRQRRRDPVMALKIACKQACHWFSMEKGPGRNGGNRRPAAKATTRAASSR